MYPSTAFALVVFLLVVTPGTAFELLWQRTRPRRDETAFVEVSRVLLTGVSFSGAALATVLALDAVTPGDLAVDASAALTEGDRYVRSRPAVVLRTLAAVPVLALLYAVVVHDLLTPAGARRIVTETGWHTAFNRLAGTRSKAFLSVEMTDGATVTGYSAGYSTDPDPAKRDLLLRAPLTIRPPGADTGVPVSAPWQIMVIPGAEIRTVAVAYVGAASPSPRPRPRLSWLRRHVWQSALAAAGVLLVVLVVATALGG
jgi:hypothetical protein